MSHCHRQYCGCGTVCTCSCDACTITRHEIAVTAERRRVVRAIVERLREEAARAGDWGTVYGTAAWMIESEFGDGDGR